MRHWVGEVKDKDTITFNVCVCERLQNVLGGGHRQLWRNVEEQKNSIMSGLVVRVVWNVIRIVQTERLAHFAGRRHGARPLHDC